MSVDTDYDRYLENLCSVIGGNDKRQDAFQSYCKGLMLPLQRKSVEPLAAHMDPKNVRSRHQSLHHFVADSPWSDSALLECVEEQVNELMDQTAQRYWLVDDTGMPKKGKHSVGVSHQYCGQVGKQANCQVAVSVSLATEAASVPVAYRLYLPKSWCEDAERRGKVGVPEDVTFQTKPEIALNQLSEAQERTGAAEPIVVADAGYGNGEQFREGVDALGLQYMVGIQTSTSVWAPWTTPKAERRRPGSKRVAPSRQRFAKDHRPQSVMELALEVHRDAWSKVSWREGTNEMLSSRFAAIRLSVAHNDRPNTEQRDEQWLLIEWPKEEPEPTKFWLSTLPATASKRQLVQVAKIRWRIERDYQELKDELGLHQYEGRNWRGFHHHASLCIAAYGFLITQRLRFPSKKKVRPASKITSLPEGYVPRGAAANATSC